MKLFYFVPALAAAVILNISCQKNIWSNVPPQDVSEIVLKSSTSILTGNSETLYPQIKPKVAYDQTLTWTSSDPSVAAVDDNGCVTGVSVGTASITVTSVNNISASCDVTVAVAPIAVTGVSISPKTSIILAPADEFYLTAKIEPSNATTQTVTWTSSDDAIAAVEASGKVTAKTAGSAVITVTTDDGGKTATCDVLVPAISVSGKSLITPGKTTALTVSITPSTSNIPSWISATPAVASVDTSGTVTAIKQGTSVITAQITSDCGTSIKSADFSMTVDIKASIASSTVASTTAYSLFESVAMDSAGNAYAAGLIGGTGTAAFGSLAATSSQSTQVALIVRYTSAGTADIVYAGDAISDFKGIAADSDDNMYAAGYFTGNSFTIASTTATGTISVNNPVIVKFDKYGLCQNIITAASLPYAAQFIAIATDSSNNIYALGINGTNSQTISFNGESGTIDSAPASSCYFIVKFNSNGKALKSWVCDNSDVTFTSIAANSSGVFTAGKAGTVLSSLFSGAPTKTHTQIEACVIWLDTDLNPTAARFVDTGGSNTSNFNSITANTSGIVYCGGYKGSVNKVWIRKYSSYDTTSDYMFTSSGSSDYSRINSIVFDDANNTLWANGYASGTAACDFGNSLTAAGGCASYNSLVMAFDANLTPILAKRSANTMEVYSSGICVKNNVLQTGGYIKTTAQASFDDISVAGSYSTLNALIVQYLLP